MLVYKLRSINQWESMDRTVRKAQHVIAVDVIEWYASGDAGNSVDEGVLDAVSDWLWRVGRWLASMQTWQVH